MTSRRAALVLLLALPLFLAMSAEDGAHTSATADFLGKVFNFVLLFGGLGYLLRKPIKAMLAKRTTEVGETIRSAANGRTEAEAGEEESQAKLAGLEGEVRALKAAAEAEGRRETARISQAAAAEAERLKKITRQELDEQARRGVGELKSYAASRAAEIARERIRRRLTPEAHAALIDKSIDKLSRIHEKPDPRP
jgi:F-type H+-transporting ATPase subunit b